jgi:hypothetical protein
MHIRALFCPVDDVLRRFEVTWRGELLACAPASLSGEGRGVEGRSGQTPLCAPTVW